MTGTGTIISLSKKRIKARRAKIKKVSSQPLSRKTRGPNKWQLTQDLEKLEARIAELESQLNEVNTNLSDTASLSTADIVDLGQRHTELEGELLEKMQTWDQKSTLLNSKLQKVG